MPPKTAPDGADYSKMVEHAHTVTDCRLPIACILPMHDDVGSDPAGDPQLYIAVGVRAAYCVRQAASMGSDVWHLWPNGENTV